MVKCNGFLMGEFPLLISVRQGCPLSAMLYSKDRDIEGISGDRINQHKILQYADDINIMVKKRKKSKEILNRFN